MKTTQKITGFTTLLFALLAVACMAQVPAVQWKVAYGGTKMDYFNCIWQNADGSFVASGDGESVDDDLNGDSQWGQQEGWLVVINSNGTIRHQKALGGSGADQLPSVEQTNDMGYVACGPSSSSDHDVPANKGLNDYWIVKTDSLLNIVWSKTYGGTGDDWPYYVHQTKDGGYIVGGRTGSSDGDVKGSHGGFDFWILKLDRNGDTVWTRTIGGSGTDDFATCAIQTKDGGYMVTGRTNSHNGDFTNDTAHGGYDAVLVKLDSNGKITWSRTYGGSGDDAARCVVQTADGGYAFCGSTTSNNMDVKGNHGMSDYWIVKVDSIGNMQWQRTEGGSKNDFPLCLTIAPDGGYVVCGRSFSYDGEVTGHHPAAATSFDSGDCWIAKIDHLNPTGPLVWELCMGGSHYDGGNWIQTTTDNGYIMAAEVYSNDGDVTGFHGSTNFEDGWVVKFAPDIPNLVNNISPYNGSVNLYPNPNNGRFTIELSGINFKSSLEIFNILGEKVYQTRLNASTNQIDLSNYSNGIYLYRVLTETGSLVSEEKFVIQK
jgi:hypothetical protein